MAEISAREEAIKALSDLENAEFVLVYTRKERTIPGIIAFATREFLGTSSFYLLAQAIREQRPNVDPSPDDATKAG